MKEMYSNEIFIRLVTLSYSRMESISQQGRGEPPVCPPPSDRFQTSFLSLSLLSPLESFQGYLYCKDPA